jgi:hypothetical protein
LALLGIVSTICNYGISGVEISCTFYIVMYNLLLYTLGIFRGRGRFSHGASLWVLLIVGACPRNSFVWVVCDKYFAIYTVSLYFTALQVGSRGFDSRWCHWDFSLTKSFRPQHGAGVDSAFNRYEYLEYFLWGSGGRCVRLTLSPSCADCLEIWEPQHLGTL